MKYLFIVAAALTSCSVGNATNIERQEISSKETDLADFTIRVMDTCRAPLSEARKGILSRQISRIAKEKFTTRSHQEAFILLICIESKFQATARSKVGAVGLTQLMPQYAQEFASRCELGKIETKDLEDSEMNLRIGACNLRHLIGTFDGNISLAFAGYNSGASSPTTKKMAKLAEANTETANYVAKYSILKEEMSRGN
jgi:hypothetical protein